MQEQYTLRRVGLQLFSTKQPGNKLTEQASTGKPQMQTRKLHNNETLMFNFKKAWMIKTNGAFAFV